MQKRRYTRIKAVEAEILRMHSEGGNTSLNSGSVRFGTRASQEVSKETQREPGHAVGKRIK